MPQRKLPAPLAVPVIFWCLGMGLAKLTALPFWLWMGVALGLLCGALIFRSLRLYFILLLCFTLGGMRYQSAQRPSALDAIFAQKSHLQQDANFLVTKQLSRETGVYEIRLEQLAGIRLREPLQLISKKELVPGQSYSALLEIIGGKQDPILDTYPVRHRANIRQNLKQMPTPKKLLPIATWRVKLLKNLDAKLGEKAEYAKALLLSDSTAKGNYRDKLSRSGMIHLIVVSGLHIWFIYAMCMVLLNALLPRRLAELVFLVLIVFYAALNHWSPSVVRSILMIGLFVVARWRSIPLGGAQLLALSMLIITAISPGQLFNIGLQLSFLCIGVILLGLPRVVWIREKDLPADKVRLFLNRTLDLLLLNVVVGIAVLPLTLYYFGTASLNGIAGNLLGIPLTGGLLVLGFLILFLPGGNLLSAAFVSSYAFMLRVFEVWMEWVASLPFFLQNTWLNHWQLIGCFLIVLTVLYMLRNIKIHHRPSGLEPESSLSKTDGVSQRKPGIRVRKPGMTGMFAVLGLGLLLIVLPGLLVKTPGGVYVFNCGTADCILIRLRDGKNLLVDTGPIYYNSPKSWADNKLLPWLRRKNINRIDYLILTHLDADHSGGFASLAKTLPTKNLLVSDETMRDPKYLGWQKAGLLKHLDVHCISDTVSFQIGSARLKFLHPDRDYYAGTTNGASLLFRLDYQSRRYLFTGDVDTAAEEHLVRRYPEEIRADYLKAGHHGSRSSSCPEFVRAVQPEEVWITASERNRWDFPHPEPLAAFHRYAHRVRSTADGTIYIPFAQKD